MTFKCDVWPRKIIGHLFYITSSFVHHLKPSVNSNWIYCPETLNWGQNRRIFVPCDLEIWRMILRNNRAPLLCFIKLCASFHTPRWIQTGVTVRKRSIRFKIGEFLSTKVTVQKHSIRVKIGDFFVPCDLEIWLMTSKNNRAPLLCYFKLCASFLSHWWIQTGVTIRKTPIWVKIDDFF